MNDLAKAALVGTAKQPHVPWTDGDPIDESIQGLTACSDESRLLLRAGSRAIYERAGQIPPRIEAVAPAPDESVPQASRRLVTLIRNAFASDSTELFPEFVRLLQAGGLSLPHELLPLALDLTDPKLRECAIPVLGPRGLWLSQFRDQWSWARTGVGDLGTEDLEALREQWDEGRVGQRSDALRRVRKADPARAREWLSDGFKKEKADHRRRFVEQFEVGLSVDDESFLESTLSDRSEGVRFAASLLLAKIPDSALSKRMCERAEEMIQASEQGVLRKRLILRCEPPETFDSAWGQDGISKKVPRGRGKRAFWAESLVAAVPLRFWTETFQAEPEVLIRAIQEDHFASDVLVGWTQAAIAFQKTDPTSANWLSPLWDHWAGFVAGKTPEAAADAYELMWGLAPLMPAEKIERGILTLLNNQPDPTSLPMERFLDSLPAPWSTTFSRAYLKLTRQLFKSRGDNAVYRWSNTLLTAGKCIPRECFTEALADWVLKDDRSRGWRANSLERQVDLFCDWIRTRASFYAELDDFTQSTPPSANRSSH